jgi:FkbM family methyltransferase
MLDDRKIYNPGQAKVLFEFWPEEAEWFVIGGVAIGNEAQTIYSKYPNINYIGFEPNLAMRESAVINFPGVSYAYALWDSNTNLLLKVPDGRDISSSVCRFSESSVGLEYGVIARSLDSLSEEFGPFTNSVLWIDIEEAELRALKGATNLLINDIKLINLEIMNKSQTEEITNYLHKFGFEEIYRWGHGSWEGVDKWDLIFKRVT